MKTMFIRSAKEFQVLIFLLLPVCFHIQAQSIYPMKIEDQKAVCFQPGRFPVNADGIHDDADALQQAIDEVERNGKFGIVLIPEGKYKLNKTIYVWKGIRLIGFGKNRPVFIRDGRDPAFDAESDRYMIHFTSNKRGDGSIQDANAGTFYSAISNIDFEVKNGNKEMVCIRSNYAQHCFISHCNFNMGEALAAVEQVGNEISDCRFINGQYAILAFRTAPGWPFVLMDSYFEGQAKAAIETEDAGLTIIRTHFKDAPSAIVTRPGKPEKLYMEDCRFEDISGTAIHIGEENNAYSQYNIKNLACINVPSLAKLRESKQEIRGQSSIYQVIDFSHGLQIQDLGIAPGIDTKHHILPLSEVPGKPETDVPALPSQDRWMDISELGATGDSEYDNTAIIQKAIDEHDVLYFPSGRYRISETLVLKPNTVLIGMNPISTQILIKDRTRAFEGTGAPKAIIESSRGGKNIISGIGIDAGGMNPRAAGIKWMAGEKSLIDDVKFLGGHGTFDTSGKYLEIYNNNRTADSDRNRKWDSQYWSLWVTDGGGGTFKDIWTASPFSQAGFYVSNTSTPGRVYGMSLEHHVRNEAQFKNVSNWKLYAFQFEEEPGEGWNALPLEIDHCSNIRFANLYFYRTSRTLSPYPYATLVKESSNLEFCNVHSYSSTRFVFDNTIYAANFKYGIRSLEISNLKISGKAPHEASRTRQSEAKKIAGGFEFIDALTADRDGNVYFTDSRWHEIYTCSAGTHEISLICDLPLSPAGLAVDRTNQLIVKTRNQSFVSLNVNQTPIEDFEILSKDSILNPGEKWVIYPAYIHSPIEEFYQKLLENRVGYYYNRDLSTAAVNTMEPREPHNLGVTKAGSKFYLVQDEMHKTYAFDVGSEGALKNPVVFAERGDYQAIADKNGNVYIVAENIFVYNADGNQIEVIEVPERPSSITFGGKNGETLFISGRTSLYAFEISAW